MIELLYYPNKNKISRVEMGVVEYNAQRPEPNSEVYFVRINEDDLKTEFWRVLGHKDGKIFITAQHTDKVDNFFFERFLQMAENLGVLERIKPLHVVTDVRVVESGKPLANKNRKRRKGGLGSLFGRKRSKVSKIYYYGDPEEVEVAREKIDGMIAQGTLPRVDEEEVITIKKISEAMGNGDNFVLFANISKLHQARGGKDLYEILVSHKVPVIPLAPLPPESRILSEIQNVGDININSVLYNKQRLIMFVHRTGGVGKTTLSLNMGLWAAKQRANIMYLEVLGGKGIDNLLHINSTSLEDVLVGDAKPKEFDVGKDTKLTVISLYEATSGIITQKANWDGFFSTYFHNDNAEKHYHCAVVDTYVDMLSTRYIYNQATDVVIVSDMRPTTQQKTIESLNDLFGNSGRPRNANYIVVHNKYQNEHKREYEKLRAKLDYIAGEYNVTLNHVIIPLDIKMLNSIVINDDYEQAKMLSPIIKLIYGVTP